MSTTMFFNLYYSSLLCSTREIHITLKNRFYYFSHVRKINRTETEKIYRLHQKLQSIIFLIYIYIWDFVNI